VKVYNAVLIYVLDMKVYLRENGLGMLFSLCLFEL
jgi:hypothetical protein